jgi:hypothetical protein
MKKPLIGNVMEPPRETRNCVRFMATFAPHEITEVVVSGTSREEARKLATGDRFMLGKWANLGYLQLAGKQITRFVTVPI